MLDLKRSEAELLADMRRQTRYEVRRADKLGVVVEKSNSEEIFKEFHRVQLKTAKRQGFVPPNLKVLMAEREAFGDKKPELVDYMLWVLKFITKSDYVEW